MAFLVAIITALHSLGFENRNKYRVFITEAILKDYSLAPLRRSEFSSAHALLDRLEYAFTEIDNEALNRHPVDYHRMELWRHDAMLSFLHIYVTLALVDSHATWRDEPMYYALALTTKCVDSVEGRHNPEKWSYENVCQANLGEWGNPR